MFQSYRFLPNLTMQKYIRDMLRKEDEKINVRSCVKKMKKYAHKLNATAVTYMRENKSFFFFKYIFICIFILHDSTKSMQIFTKEKKKKEREMKRYLLVGFIIFRFFSPALVVPRNSLLKSRKNFGFYY